MKIINKISPTLALIGLAFSSNLMAEAVRIQVNIENISPDRGSFLTPAWVGFHDGIAFDTYNGNTPASSLPFSGSQAMERICEDGSTDAIADDFFTLQPLGIDTTIPGLRGLAGPIDPGEIVSESFILDSDGPNRYFSYASMIIPSNDFCISNGNPKAHPIFDNEGNFIAQSFFVQGSETLDAGTEINDELPGNTAFFGQSKPNTGEDENGNIGTLGSDLPATGFQAPSNRDGTPNILGTPRFSQANFLQAGYSSAKFTFSAAPAITEDLRFYSQLNSDQQVPTNSSRARGRSSMTLLNEGTHLRLRLKTFKLKNVTAIHLHLGEEGSNGPVVVNLLDDSAKTVEFYSIFHRLTNTIESEDLTGPLQGQPLDALVAKMKDGQVYLNIHTKRFPDGAIRGQVSLK